MDFPTTENYKFFSHKECEWFPCHNVKNPDDFNCLFCYCPLYCLDDKCGGNPTYTDRGIKDCSKCTLPHRRDAYEIINPKFVAICEAMGQDTSWANPPAEDEEEK